MKSPFPGMDPFIETCGLWEDFHKHLIEHIGMSLADRVPEKYFVRTGTRNYVVVADAEANEKTHGFLPDVDVSGPAGRRRRSSGTGVLDDPALETDTYTVRALISEEFSESFVEIHAADPERRVVTCIELLSPSNKRKDTPGWDQYLLKRQALLLGEANLVEIDLLRGGRRMPMVDPLPNSPYYLLVARKTKAPYCRVTKAHYRHALRVIPIPLEYPDPDVPLDLQSIIDTIYTRFRYGQQIDYTKSLKPRLPKEDAAWLRQALKQASPKSS